MLTFMDYVVQSFGDATNWNRDNAYSSLTASPEAILDFPTPQHLRLHVSSLASPQFATSYSLGTVGLLDGTISYLYTTLPMRIPSQTLSIPLRTLVPGYRQLQLPVPPSAHGHIGSHQGRKDTLLNATLHLPSPSRLTGLYMRRTSPETLFTLFLNSTRATTPSNNPPPAALLAHVSHDAGKYSIEGLASTDNALFGVRGLWNFGADLSSSSRKAGVEAGSNAEETSAVVTEGLVEIPSPQRPVRPKPSLLSAGAEFYYSPLSSVIGLSAGLRATTLPTAQSLPATSRQTSKPRAGASSALSSQLPSNISGSSFPYTLTLTLTPLTGSLASTYSVRASPSLSLSSRFGFNVYSWESEYVLGAEIWRKSRRLESNHDDELQPVDNLEWARNKMAEWYEEGKQKITEIAPLSTVQSSSLPNDPTAGPRILDTDPPSSNHSPSPVHLQPTSLSSQLQQQQDQEEESVIKLRVDNAFNFRALWTGRIKELLVSAGFTVGPSSASSVNNNALNTYNAGVGVGAGGPFRGSFGVEVVYSS